MPARRFGIFIWLLFAFALLLPARAAGNANSLAAAINAANASGSGAITLSADIALSWALPAITGSLTIDGKSHSISGNEQFRIFDIDGGSLALNDIRLIAGKAESGGAIRLLNGARLTIQGSTLRDNIAETKGGAIYAVGSAVTVRDSHFEMNCVRLLTRRLNPAGKGPDRIERSLDDDGCPLVTQYRSSLDPGGEVDGEGGAIHLSSGARANIQHSTFSHNKATNGGAIATGSDSSRLSIERSSFVSNQSSSLAGAIYANRGASDIRSSSFVKNATITGGGALSSGAGAVNISNSTFSENQSETGAGAVHLHGSAVFTITHATFVNNWSLYRDAGAIMKHAGGTARLRNSIISGTGRDEDCVGGLDQSISNLSADGTCAIKASEDPLLGEFTGAPGYYPLLDHSPAIDAADPRFCAEADQLGAARDQDHCDIGAIEAMGLAAAPEPIVPPPACSLADQIIAANTDRPFAGCKAGNGADTITLTRNILLFAPLPSIKSVIAIEGNGHTISGDNKFRIFDVDYGNLTVKNLTMMDGSAPSGNGGAIRLQNGGHASVSDSSFIGNYADNGGAIALDSLSYSSRLTVHNSRFVRNRASRTGGAIGMNYGRATITNSSFMSSLAGQSGGAISMLNHPKLEVSNSSFFNGGSGWGGSALAAENGADATLTHVTMYNSNPTGAGSELNVIQSAYGSPSRVRLRNSIIAEAGPGYILLCQGNLTENVSNIIEGGTCSPMLEDDPLLEELSDNATFIAPLPGSPAIRAADPSFCTETDQLGKPRAISGNCDIGAIETVPVVSNIGECQVSATHNLNFRDGPNGSKVGFVPQGSKFASRARTPGWFQVEHQGETGWISADYVISEGACA